MPHFIIPGEGGGGVEEAPNDGKRYARQNGAWSELEATATGRPITPINLSPTAGELNVYERPLFESTPFGHPVGTVTMYGYQLVIMQGNTTIYDSGNLQLTNTSFRIPAGFLDESQTYTWSVRYQDHQLNWSDWSAPTGFTTQAVFGSGFVLRPAILLPENGGVLNTPYPLVILSSWDAAGAGLMQGQSTIQVSGDPTFATTIESVQTASRVWQSSVSYPRGEAFCVRARDTAATGEVSSWSSVSCFTVRTLFRQQRIGIVLTDPDNFVFRRVDGNFNPVEIDGDYWLENAVYAGLTASKGTTLFGQEMLVLPAFWINSGIVPTGQFAGKRFWMIDPTTPTQADRDAGWHRHDAFYNPSGGFQDSLPISAHRIRNVAGKAASTATGNAYQTTKDGHRAVINALNTDIDNTAMRGWTPFGFRVFEALKLLMLIEYGSLSLVHQDIVVPQNRYRGLPLYMNSGDGLYIAGITPNTAVMSDGVSVLTIPNMTNPVGVRLKVDSIRSATDIGQAASITVNDYLMPLGLTGIPADISTMPHSNVLSVGSGGQSMYVNSGVTGFAGFEFHLAPKMESLMVKMD